MMKEFQSLASVHLAELEDLFVDMKARVRSMYIVQHFLVTEAGQKKDFDL